MRNPKYPNGYLPKIAYHMAQGNRQKVEYFVGRHVQQHGPLTDKDLEVIAKTLSS
jgi:hypothetical protein